jgi:hypothetical protein
MENIFYYDANGEKQGPVNAEQFRALVKQAIIRPYTKVETEDGRQTVAGEFLQHSDFDKLPWQFDYEKHLWTCNTIKTINGIVAVLWGIAATFWFLAVIAWADFATPGLGLFGLIGIVGVWVAVTLQILVVRMICDWSLITSKAAQFYVERCERE